MTTPAVTLFHAPHTRSTGVLTLLEELGVAYELNVLNLKAGEQRKPEYLAVNPMGKVPAVRHGDALITEQVALYIYLADAFPDSGLAPAIGDPLRGPYLRWIAFYGSCFEPAVVDRALKREPAPMATSPYGDYATTIKTIDDQLAQGDYLLGDRFSAADVLWGTALGWTTGFGLVAHTPAIDAYIARVAARPAFVGARAKDAQLAAAQA
ncbi:glutathione S-transferase family protein [Niveibacterium umoris]|uniref:Glutathione S-transferase n=1 Tax=Niveibacterium umoris TaxID=1193620 RepID=A0A840BLP7_9RHOO|nr:glutathione S-transferase family protein [Niveibacterium umoris]MBB4013384.1 glutathione S-transferase [Niveibacterium umoris]